MQPHTYGHTYTHAYTYTYTYIHTYIIQYIRYANGVALLLDSAVILPIRVYLYMYIDTCIYII